MAGIREVGGSHLYEKETRIVAAGVHVRAVRKSRPICIAGSPHLYSWEPLSMWKEAWFVQRKTAFIVMVWSASYPKRFGLRASECLKRIIHLGETC